LYYSISISLVTTSLIDLSAKPFSRIIVMPPHGADDDDAASATEEEASRYRAMVEFIGTFKTLSGNPPQEMSDLADGVALFEALSEM
jgi:hypothetical protein